MNLSHDINLKDLVRTIPDYPKPGIMFRDITTLLGHANGFRTCVEQLARPFTNRRVQLVAGIEARGFILGGAVADRLRCGFIPIRKKGKLPAKAIGQDYELEYGIRCCLSTTSSPPAARRKRRSSSCASSRPTWWAPPSSSIFPISAARCGSRDWALSLTH